ncbi:kinase-like protein [Amylocystis lapponica]|nr:kinase-like protein [Amylocystis lapponica]
MFDESELPSPSNALVALAPLDPEWQPILHVSNQVVLYNPTSHALSIRTHSRHPRSSSPALALRAGGDRCPYCHRFLPGDLHEEDTDDSLETEFVDGFEGRTRAANYFQLLEIANDTASRPASPHFSSSPGFTPLNIGTSGDTSGSTSAQSAEGSDAFRAGNMAEGYFKAFFREECRLGMGANGSVFLCQHVLDGNLLGHFAVKKIAVGQSHSYLLTILREVRLLESLHHPNIVTYHHAWLETCQFSSFGPKVPTLHILMQFAEGGSLDDFIDARLGRLPPATAPSATPSSRTARIRAFRAYQRATPAERERLRREMGLGGGPDGGAVGSADWKAVHLLSAEEVKGLFGDVVAGLAFLHDKSILHLDLKPGNVLLTWDEGRLIPRAMLSDFGTSQDMLKSRTRSGNTGTLEYTSPESLPSPFTGVLRQVDSKADMWSVGMILHKLLFFRLPYSHASDSIASEKRGDKETADMLEKEVASYTGFKSSSSLVDTFQSRRLSHAYLVLLEGLLNVTPSARPSSERVLSAIREGTLDPLTPERSRRTSSRSSLIPVPIRRGLSTTMAPGFSDVTEHGHVHELTASSSRETVSQAVAPDPSEEKRMEAAPALGLPAPAPSPWNGNSAWTRTVRVAGKQMYVRIPKVIWGRTVKSCLLVAKVLSVTYICPETRPHALVWAVILVLAVVDTWFDDLSVTLMLAATHVVLVRLACWGGRCCI